MELRIARNPDADSSLPFLLWLPLDGGLVFRTKGTWPRTSALYCHPVDVAEWPQVPDIVERVPLRACTRRGAAIDVICDRGREQRSQIVFTRARGRDVVFWQSPRTRKQSRPAVRLPTARGHGIVELEILVDAHERYPFTFTAQRAQTTRQGLPCGDYAIVRDGRILAAVERKSLSDLVSSLSSGRLGYQLGELATLPRAAVVVEDRFSQIFALRHQRPAVVADGLAELQIRWPTVPIVYCENRKLAEEWTYRYLAAAHAWVPDDAMGHGQMHGEYGFASEKGDPAPDARELRAWARTQGFQVADRGRIRPEILQAWQHAHATTSVNLEQRGAPARGASA